METSWRLRIAVMDHRFVDGTVLRGDRKVTVRAVALREVLQAYATYYRPYRSWVNPSIASIAELALCNYDTARMATAILLERGYLQCLDRGGHGRADSGRYRIAPDPLLAEIKSRTIRDKEIKSRTVREEVADSPRKRRGPSATSNRETVKREPVPLPSVDELMPPLLDDEQQLRADAAKQVAVTAARSSLEGPVPDHLLWTTNKAGPADRRRRRQNA